MGQLRILLKLLQPRLNLLLLLMPLPSPPLLLQRKLLLRERGVMLMRLSLPLLLFFHTHMLAFSEVSMLLNQGPLLPTLLMPSLLSLLLMPLLPMLLLLLPLLPPQPLLLLLLLPVRLSLLLLSLTPAMLSLIVWIKS